MLNLGTELYSPHSFRIAEEEARLLHFKREHIHYSSNVSGLEIGRLSHLFDFI